jgi:phosphatidylethanolamine-binding protein (PEBP) family uncharacterized protein
VAALAVTGCSTGSPGPTAQRTPGTFNLTSPAYEDSGTIPDKYGCNGERISPPLAWNGAPADTKGFVLVMEDVGNIITHWVVLNVPGSSSGSLPEGYSGSPDATLQLARYMAPCPGVGLGSLYRITMYALSAPMVVPSFDPTNLSDYRIQAMIDEGTAGKVIATAVLEGMYTQK